MKLTKAEERAVAEALPAWRSAFALVNKHAPGSTVRRATKYQGETADSILARHGITLGRIFTEPYSRYGIVEAELRRRGRKPAHRASEAP